MDYLLPQSSLCGLMYVGIAVCGIYGVYSNVPEDPENPGNPVNPDDPSFPQNEALQIRVSINGVERNIKKNTLRWDRSAGSSGTSQASFTLETIVANRPKPFMIVQVGVGSFSNLLYAGIITSVSDTWIGNVDPDSEFAWSVNTVGFHHYLVRRKISIGEQNAYASDIIRTILNTFLAGQLFSGTMTSGQFYSLFYEKEQSASAIIQKLSQESDAIAYVDPYRRLHFLKSGDRAMPFNLEYIWTFDQGWSFPDNNFSNVQVSEDGDQVVTRLLLHAAKYVSYLTKHKARHPEAGLVLDATNTTPIVVTLNLPGYSGSGHSLNTGDTIEIVDVTGNTGANGTWVCTHITNTTISLDDSTGNGTYEENTGRWSLKDQITTPTSYGSTDPDITAGDKSYAISPGQSQFSTERPIGYVKWIHAEWTYYRTNGTVDEGSRRWYDPMGHNREDGIATGNISAPLNEQLPMLDAISDYNMSFLGAQVKGSGSTERWEPCHQDYDILSWELSPEESGRSIMNALQPEGDPPEGVQEKDAYDFPFDWKINYGSNTVEFIANIELTDSNEPGKIKFTYVEIRYEELVYTDYTYEDYDQKAIIAAYDPSSDGIIEVEAEERTLTTQNMRQAYADAFFNLRSEPRLSLSYVHYVKGNGILNQDIYPGMSQVVDIHGRDTTLVVEKISYEILQGLLPVIKMTIQLATKQKDLAGLVKRLLTGRD